MASNLIYIKRLLCRFILPLAVILFAITSLAQTPSAQINTIQGIRIWHAPDHTRVVFDMSQKGDYSISLLDKPSRYVVDFKKITLTGKIPVNQTNLRIEQLRAGPVEKDRYRVVIPIKKSLQLKSFQLEPNQLYGHRLVIDLFDADTEQLVVENQNSNQTAQSNTSNSKSARQNYAQPAKQKKEVIIAIDAGHGGEDPGALGSRSREKNITLDISKRLARKINNTKGMRAVLIRDRDYFVKLRDRMEKARKANADLFVSIHADAALNKSARGMSVFALSQRGASSELARSLARKQNQADLIGGVSIRDKDDELAQVLIDLSLTNKISESVELGTLVLKRLSKLGKLHSKRVEQAGFVVLKSPDIPSILVETGFITNRSEEKRLLTKRFQTQLSDQIYSGIVDYINSNPIQVADANFQITPSNHSLSDFEEISETTSNTISNTTQATQFHTVRSGDTLLKIASRYGISLKQLKQWNNLKNNIAAKGKRLRVSSKQTARPTSSQTTSTSRKIIRHKVKRGDTLSTIAQRYGDTMRAIRSRNKLKSSTVFLGQSLKVSTKVTVKPKTIKSNQSSSASTNKSSKTVHIVKRGEFLSSISARYNISIKYIKRLNKLKSNNIYVGQRLIISQSGLKGSTKPANNTAKKTITHKVRRGETLSGLALKYRVKQADIVTWNKLKKRQLIIGQRLTIKNQ